MDHPSRVLAQAREHLEALKQSGLSRDALLALLGEEPQQQQPQQQQQQQQQATMIAEGMRCLLGTISIAQLY